jgi:ribosomal protein S12 methylthiotransferase accessory factor
MTSAAALTPPLRRAVSSYTGIVRTLDECLVSTSEPRLYRATCEVAAAEQLLGSSLGHLSGIGGSGLSRAEAACAAVGEALERYSASFVPRERLVVASASELGATAVDPGRFALFSERQYALPSFPFRRFTRETAIAWAEGVALPGGERVFVPAELVYLGDVVTDERPIAYATSSGTACAASRREAVERGLFELLERDAFMIVWANRLSLPSLEWSGDERIVELDRRFFAPTGLHYSAIDLSSFHGVPCVLGVVRAREGRLGALGIGAGTAATIERAWLKALSEAFAARAAGVKLVVLDDRDYGALGEGVGTFEDHIRFYARAERAGPADFLDASPAGSDVGAISSLRGDSVAALCACVDAAGSSAYAVDVTSPDVADLGLVVIKVIAPELCALDVAHRARFLGGQRLYDAAYELGLRAGPLSDDDVNPYPHPFP